MYTYKAKVINVVDGDTIDCLVDVGFNVTLVHRLRLLNCNTSEMTSKDVSERELAVKARDFVKNEVLGKDVIISTQKSDSFGRYLALVWSIDEKGDKEVLDLSTILKASGLAREYVK